MDLFYDESGNTGVDLLNSDQPLFSLASTSLDSSLAKELIAPLLRPGQAEVKYSKLKSTKQGQSALVEFFSSDHFSVHNSKFTIADKEYYLISHIVDKLIEPCLFDHGVDLYINDAHVGLTNIWYYTGESIFPRYWRKILRAFVEVIRQRNHDVFNKFDALLTQAAKDVPVDSRDFAAGLLVCRGQLNRLIGVYESLVVFDPAVDLFISLTNKWMEESSGTFHVIHDRSKPLKRSEEFLRALMTPLGVRTIGYGNRKSELPLRISDLEFGDSSSHPQIQVADLIAGAAIDCLMAWSGKKPSQDYHEALKGTHLDTLFCDGMLPSPKNITKGNPSKPGEINLVDGSTQFLLETGYFNR